jgi:periplasmic protein TonB
MAVSLTLQCAILSAIILWSILHIEALGPISLPDPLPPFPRGAAVKIVDVQRSPAPAHARSITVQPKQFTAPARTQSAAVAPAPVIEAPVVGQSGGGLGVMNGVLNTIADAADTLTRGTVPAIATRAAPAPKTPAIPEPLRRIGGDVLEARIINRVLPEYPPLARQMRVSGAVQLVGVISRDGQVKSLEVISGHPLLVKAALAAVQQWRYRPTMLNGEPVEVIAPITVNFLLAR